MSSASASPMRLSWNARIHLATSVSIGRHCDPEPARDGRPAQSRFAGGRSARRAAPRQARPAGTAHRSAKARAGSTGPSTPARSSSRRSATSRPMAAGSSTSLRTRLWGGVRRAAATTRSPARTAAKYGRRSPKNVGWSRTYELIPKIRLCSASRASRKSPATAMNASTSGKVVELHPADCVRLTGSGVHLDKCPRTVSTGVDGLRAMAPAPWSDQINNRSESLQ